MRSRDRLRHRITVRTVGRIQMHTVLRGRRFNGSSSRTDALVLRIAHSKRILTTATALRIVTTSTPSLTVRLNKSSEIRTHNVRLRAVHIRSKSTHLFHRQVKSRQLVRLNQQVVQLKI